MKFLKACLFISVIFFTSCTITQEFQFNKDYSGNTKLSIDMGSLMEMMSGMDSSGTKKQDMKDSLDFVFKESQFKLDSLGIKNIKYGWEGTNVLFMSYDFENIETLNKSLNASSQSNGAFGKALNTEPHTFFVLKGNELSYKGPKSKNDLGNNPDMESMKDYYKYNIIFSFEREIKKADNPNFIISTDKKKAELRGSMFES